MSHLGADSYHPPPSQPSEGNNLLVKALKKAFKKAKTLPLRVDPKTGEIKLTADRYQLGTLFLETPFMFFPDYERINLIGAGKACAYCGGVLKVDDAGRMRDSPNLKRPSTDSKMNRYMSGLDCNECALRWCSPGCHEADWSHSMLHHRPENRSGTSQFIDCDGNHIDLLKYDSWHKLMMMIITQGLEVCYYGVLTVLQIHHDHTLRGPFSELHSGTSDDILEQADYIRVPFETLEEVYELLMNCFKKLDLRFDEFVRYLAIHRCNNYAGSIYLVASSLKRTADDSNCRVDLYDAEAADQIESIIFKPTQPGSVEVIRESYLHEKKEPIHTCRRSPGCTSILKVTNMTKLAKSQVLTLKDADYTVPSDNEDAIFIEEMDDTITMLKAPPQSNRRTSRASFTSSGSSFGEGIIKYNRQQIRDMLGELTIGSEEAEGYEVAVPTTFGQRRKSVHFNN